MSHIVKGLIISKALKESDQEVTKMTDNHAAGYSKTACLDFT